MRFSLEVVDKITINTDQCLQLTTVKMYTYNNRSVQFKVFIHTSHMYSNVRLVLLMFLC